MDFRDVCHQGDALEVLRQIPDGVIQCCVTSPPYWGLRDYGHRKWFIGDNPDCGHSEVKEGGYEGHRGNRGQVPQTKWLNQKEYPQHKVQGDTKIYTCQQCGAWYGQLGLEPTPQEYVVHLVELFREVRRVLRDDGTFWLNLGDSFASDTKWGGATSGKHVKELHGATSVGRAKRSSGLKPKDLVGIPWRTAFALQDDGWWLRSEIIWAKGNAMPEAVKDRPTKAHEHIFLLTKSQDYFYDHEAILEPFSSSQFIPTFDGSGDLKGERNKRSVWSINPRPYQGAHFAVFPEELPATCIRAGTSEKGCCSACGAPWARSEAGKGWEPTCQCKDASVVPCLVLDPFAGSGTTLAVAAGLNRSYLGIELNPAYHDLIRERLDRLNPWGQEFGREMLGL